MAVLRCTRLLGALCAVLLASPLGTFYVLAEDEPAVADPPADAPEMPALGDASADLLAAVGDAQDMPEETEEEKAKKAEAFVDSARELNEKLAQLKALLDAKGEGADPALKERLMGLQKQLSGLGLDGLGEIGGPTPELSDFIEGCVVLSMRRTGVRRPATVSALKVLSAGKLTPEEASGMELYRMVAVCIQEFTQEDVELFKAGKMQLLPKSYVDASKEPKTTALVTGMEAQHWEVLKTIATQLVKEMGGDTEQEKPPVMMGLVAGVPVLCGVGFLIKKFFDMQGRQEQEKADKAARKQEKKGK